MSAGIRAALRVNHPGFSLDVDLALPGRGVTVLSGPSGCGKTTCLRAIAGLQRTPGNHVVVNGARWQDGDVFVPTHRRAIGYVFQETRLFAHLDVRRNLEYGMRRVPPSARRVSLAQAVELLGIGALMTRQPQTLSGGERQRVGMARALATSPDLLLMDEPLASLDAERKREVLPYLERLHGELDIPVLYVTHAPDEIARLADHLVLLDAGRVVAAGAAAALMTQLDLPLAHGDTAGAVIRATVVGHEPDYHLTQVEFAGGRLHLPHRGTRIGQAVRVRIQARDVSLTLHRQSDTSVLNILPATVTELVDDSPGQTMVGLDLGGTRILARITRKSADLLQLAPGTPVHAQVKGVAIVE
ncbi:molybdenum ABC transporter ATP-binding protein [Variovorax sp. J22G21]|uniref:molybdenum ABC transporter ATP-binding protein n=1 Tax=Variovorax fucosicus TaxID=3053517 RepID=UPI00257578B4|nr:MULTISPECIES: molybdenum ABC transporter ATP-binding protein [unclassified Variovorax]MDM0040411.1 molybdenum ABC transporter ATP-binding protein [Variovorax sp. J22R193]MDM0061784.1 molybdenum ABC transporter ATP-binding protein [Variovorax sp. J22G21]